MPMPRWPPSARMLARFRAARASQERDPRLMSRVGARREREGTIPRATAVPRLAKPARHAGYAPGAHRSIVRHSRARACGAWTPVSAWTTRWSGARAVLLRRHGRAANAHRAIGRRGACRQPNGHKAVHDVERAWFRLAVAAGAIVLTAAGARARSPGDPVRLVWQ